MSGCMLGLAFHHIGVACSDISAATEYVKAAYDIVSDSGTVHDPEQNADLRLFNEGSPGAIELVSGPIVASLLSRRTSYYHICYTTPDIRDTLQRARALGAIPVGPPKPAVLFQGRLVAFVYTPLGLVEFLETGGEPRIAPGPAPRHAIEPEIPEENAY